MGAICLENGEDMNAQTFLLGMLAESNLHPGTGQSSGVVDLPVARERPTGFPQLPDTSLKGALRQRDKDDGLTWIDEVYGNEKITGAGELIVSSGRLLLLPLRRLDGPYAWATCPLLLERFWRDHRRCFKDAEPFLETYIPKVNDGDFLSVNGAERLHLEERVFKRSGAPDRSIAPAIAHLISADGKSAPAGRLAEQLAILSDKDFGWFCENGLPVQARNKLDDDKISEDLWYEETLPPDTLLYAILGARHVERTQHYDGFLAELDKRPYLQIGGNETVGQGWLRTVCVKLPIATGDGQ